MDITLEDHLKAALYELTMVKLEYIKKKNRQKADIVERAIQSLVKNHRDLIDKWSKEAQEKPKKPEPVIESIPIESSSPDFNNVIKE